MSSFASRIVGFVDDIRRARAARDEEQQAKDDIKNIYRFHWRDVKRWSPDSYSLRSDTDGGGMLRMSAGQIAVTRLMEGFECHASDLVEGTGKRMDGLTIRRIRGTSLFSTSVAVYEIEADGVRGRLEVGGKSANWEDDTSSAIHKLTFDGKSANIHESGAVGGDRRFTYLGEHDAFVAMVDALPRIKPILGDAPAADQGDDYDAAVSRLVFRDGGLPGRKCVALLEDMIGRKLCAVLGHFSPLVPAVSKRLSDYGAEYGSEVVIHRHGVGMFSIPGQGDGVSAVYLDNDWEGRRSFGMLIEHRSTPEKPQGELTVTLFGKGKGKGTASLAHVAEDEVVVPPAVIYDIGSGKLTMAEAMSADDVAEDLFRGLRDAVKFTLSKDIDYSKYDDFKVSQDFRPCGGSSVTASPSLSAAYR